VSAFIDEHRARFGVEPICRELEVSDRAYRQRRVGVPSRRVQSDAVILGEIQSIHAETDGSYGSWRCWRQLRKDGYGVAGCTVERVMRQAGSREYTQQLKDAGIAPSRGRTGTAHDNAMAESVIATIKTELTNRRPWPTRLDLELALITWIGCSNERRIHRALDGKTPPKSPTTTIKTTPARNPGRFRSRTCSPPPVHLYPLRTGCTPPVGHTSRAYRGERTVADHKHPVSRASARKPTLHPAHGGGSAILGGSRDEARANRPSGMMASTET